MPVTARQKLLTAAKLAKYDWAQFLVMACGSSMGTTGEQKQRLMSYYKIDRHTLSGVLSEIKVSARSYKNGIIRERNLGVEK